jgi:hypothetical protein
MRYGSRADLGIWRQYSIAFRGTGHVKSGLNANRDLEALQPNGQFMTLVLKH